MKLLREGNRDTKLHPEVREQFHELLRFHFSPFRRGKDVHQIRQEMRARDAADQKALLAGNCEMKIVVTHQRSCDSRIGGFGWSMPCDCTPTREIKFLEAKKSGTNIKYPAVWYAFDNRTNSDGDDVESKEIG